MNMCHKAAPAFSLTGIADSRAGTVLVAQHDMHADPAVVQAVDNKSFLCGDYSRRHPVSAVLAEVRMDRATYIGSSDVAALMRVSKRRTPPTSISRRPSRRKITSPTGDRARILRRGHQLEPFIVQMGINAPRCRASGRTGRAGPRAMSIPITRSSLPRSTQS